MGPGHNLHRIPFSSMHVDLSRRSGGAVYRFFQKITSRFVLFLRGSVLFATRRYLICWIVTSLTYRLPRPPRHDACRIPEAKSERARKVAWDNYHDFMRGCVLRVEIFTPVFDADQERCHELLQCLKLSFLRLAKENIQRSPELNKQAVAGIGIEVKAKASSKLPNRSLSPSYSSSFIYADACPAQ